MTHIYLTRFKPSQFAELLKHNRNSGRHRKSRVKSAGLRVSGFRSSNALRGEQVVSVKFCKIVWATFPVNSFGVSADPHLRSGPFRAARARPTGGTRRFPCSPVLLRNSFPGSQGRSPRGVRGGAPCGAQPHDSLWFTTSALGFRRPAPIPDAVPSVALSTPPYSSTESLPPSPRESPPPRRGSVASNSPGSGRCAPPASVVSAPG